MDNALLIQAESRHEISKKLNKSLRRSKKMPAIIYGGQEDALAIAITQEDMKRILKSEKGENTLLSIQREGHSVDAMLKDIQYDHLTDRVIHVDFVRVDVNRAVVVNVPIHVTGEAYGVKNEDGFFEVVNREVRIQCLPAAIPNAVSVDISDLHLNQSIKYGDLKLGDDIRCMSDPHMVICMVTNKYEEEAKAAEPAAETAEAAPAAAAAATPAAAPAAKA